MFHTWSFRKLLKLARGDLWFCSSLSPCCLTHSLRHLIASGPFISKHCLCLGINRHYDGAIVIAFSVAANIFWKSAIKSSTGSDCARGDDEETYYECMGRGGCRKLFKVCDWVWNGVGSGKAGIDKMSAVSLMDPFGEATEDGWYEVKEKRI